MASYTSANIGRSFSGGRINVAFIRTRSYFLHQQLTPPTLLRHTIPAFLAPLLLDFLQLQCQGQVDSPFETHPKTMFVSITSLFVYCFAYDAELRSSSTEADAPVISRVKAVSDSLCLVSLASILCPDSVALVFYLLYTLFLASEFEFVHCQLQMLWNWLHQIVISTFLRERRTRRASFNRRFRFITQASADRGGLLPLYQ